MFNLESPLSPSPPGVKFWKKKSNNWNTKTEQKINGSKTKWKYMYMNNKKNDIIIQKKNVRKGVISYLHLLLTKPKGRSGVNLIELLKVYFTSIAIAFKL